MIIRTSQLVQDGFQYLESARWHEGELWFSDVPAGQVWRMKPGDAPELAVELQGPSGIGFMPDGSALVVSQEQNKLLRIVDNTTELVADLDGYAIKGNDMWIGPTGRAYITQIGWDYYQGEAPASSGIVIMEPDGDVRVEGAGLMCPNGIGLTADGKTLFVAETFAGRVTAFDVDEKGSLSGQRVHAQFPEPPEGLVDGLCVDSQGAVWVTVPFQGEIRRIAPDGLHVATVVGKSRDDSFMVSCALGGPDRANLFICEMTVSQEQIASHFKGSVGRVTAVSVDVPGFSNSPT
jgi:sugar lactone lactonase YvrE